LIKATFRKTQKGKIYFLKVSGHSIDQKDNFFFCQTFLKISRFLSCNFFKEKNIICAAVSAMTQMVILGIKKIIGEDFVADIKSGFVSFEVPETFIDDEKIQILMESLKESFVKINLKYGDHIIIEE